MICPCGFGELNAHRFTVHLRLRHKYNATEKDVMRDFFHFNVEPFSQLFTCRNKQFAKKCGYKTPFADMLRQHACASDMEVRQLPEDITFRRQLRCKMPIRGMPPPNKRRVPPYLWPHWQAAAQAEQIEEQEFQQRVMQMTGGASQQEQEEERQVQVQEEPPTFSRVAPPSSYEPRPQRPQAAARGRAIGRERSVGAGRGGVRPTLPMSRSVELPPVPQQTPQQAPAPQQMEQAVTAPPIESREHFPTLKEVPEVSDTMSRMRREYDELVKKQEKLLQQRAATELAIKEEEAKQAAQLQQLRDALKAEEETKEKQEEEAFRRRKLCS